MKRGWGCGADLTDRQIRTSGYARTGAASDHGDQPREEVESQAQPPTGPHMLCGWRCGARLTASQLRANFTESRG
jgi:hypothetical protein